jgi:hypothetical protein
MAMHVSASFCKIDGMWYIQGIWSLNHAAYMNGPRWKALNFEGMHYSLWTSSCVVYHKWKASKDAAVSEYDMGYKGWWFHHIMSLELLLWDVFRLSCLRKCVVPREIEVHNIQRHIFATPGPLLRHKIYCQLNTCLIGRQLSAWFSMSCLSLLEAWMMDAMHICMHAVV